MPWAGETGHNPRRLESNATRRPLGISADTADSHVFLCGNPGMIDEMLTILAAEGFIEQTKKVVGQVHLERYR